MSAPSPGWREAYRDATEAPHPAVKERVWRGLQDGPRPRSTRRVVLAVAALGAVGAAIALLIPSGSVARAGDGYAYVATGATLREDGTRLALEHGRLAVSAWKTPVVVMVKSTRVEVEGAVAIVEVAAERVSVHAVEGVVTVDGLRQVASAESRTAAGALDDLRALEPPDAPVLRAEAAAERASRERRWEEATEALDVVAASGSLRAEAALLKRGEIELRGLRTAERALATFDAGDTRFPKGTLAMERALSAIEACVALERWVEVVARCDRFLATFPESNRADEVRRARAAAANNGP